MVEISNPATHNAEPAIRRMQIQSIHPEGSISDLEWFEWLQQRFISKQFEPSNTGCIRIQLALHWSFPHAALNGTT